ncbi:MAG: GNAT family N-acetyltransferase [Myxococcota bacterium]|nr:GNAT family N-acetyltransferase [Myxococcota bacterium]
MTGRVRRAEFVDLDRVSALWTLITRHHEPIDPVFRMREGIEGELKEMLRGIARDPDSEIFVYEDGGDLPGMLIVRIDRAQPIMAEVERAEITDLGVRAGARRRGIATSLLGEALRWIRASGVDRVEVQVAHANPEGQAFWRSQGFGDFMDVLNKRL